eukprot:scaffold3156_cov268-Chaetoceros_neogracile.AAC.26
MAATDEYDRFHRMIAGPFTAQRCIANLRRNHGGCILFLPSDLPSADEIYLHDASSLLNLLSYYALVFASFTGLSTLLGLTQTIDIQEYPFTSGVPVWPPSKRVNVDILKSEVDTKVHVTDETLQYVQSHVESQNYSDHSGQVTLCVVRRYEYTFYLLGNLHVLMLHFVSSRCPETLHLVEVYHIKNDTIRFIFRWVFRFIGLALRFFLGDGNTKKREDVKKML